MRIIGRCCGSPAESVPFPLLSAAIPPSCLARRKSDTMRSHYCGQVTETLLDQDVTLLRLGASPPRSRRRDLRRSARPRGSVQVVIDPDVPDAFANAERVRNEYVLRVIGRAPPARGHRKSPRPPARSKCYSRTGNRQPFRAVAVPVGRRRYFRGSTTALSLASTCAGRRCKSALRLRAWVIGALRRLLEERGFWTSKPRC